ncbi:MAG: PCRF domain-containing protein, partial [Sandarakinorhabdus sp.]|nr:PCRF domain-containing protein [Sandarakinorhabdus sp.]
MIISPERIAQIERRHADLAAQMGNPSLAADKFVQLSKDYAELTPVVEAAAALRVLRDEAEGLRSIPANDEMYEIAQEELAAIAEALPAAERAMA